MEVEDRRRPARILVALDSTERAARLVEAAARFARRWSAALEGLYVEDIELVNLAGLPIAREVHRLSGHTRAFDLGALEETLRTERARAEQTLVAVTARLGIGASFAVRRGRVGEEIALAARGADLLVIGCAGLVSPGRSRIGGNALAALCGATSSVLLADDPERATKSIALLIDSTDAGRRALALTRRLAHDADRVLVDLLVARNRAEAARGEVEQALSGLDVPVRIETRTDDEPTGARLEAAARTLDSDLLVLGVDDSHLGPEDYRALVDAAHSPVLVVR